MVRDLTIKVALRVMQQAIKEVKSWNDNLKMDGSKFVTGMWKLILISTKRFFRKRSEMIRLGTVVLIRWLVANNELRFVLTQNSFALTNNNEKQKQASKNSNNMMHVLFLLAMTIMIVQCIITLLSHFQVHLRNRLQELSACFAFFHNQNSMAELFLLFQFLAWNFEFLLWKSFLPNRFCEYSNWGNAKSWFH